MRSWRCKSFQFVPLSKATKLLGCDLIWNYPAQGVLQMLWPSYDQTLIQCCRQGFCTWNHVFWCFIFLTKVLKLRTWALERRMYHCCWWRMAFLRALSVSPALCSPSLSTTVVFWISSFDAYQTLCHSMRDEGLLYIRICLFYCIVVDCFWTDPWVILFTLFIFNHICG